MEEWEEAMKTYMERDQLKPQKTHHSHRHHFTAIPYGEALAKLHSVAKSITPNIVNVSITDSVNRIAATCLQSPTALPHFDNSAMDGYTVHSSALRHASPSNPLSLRVVGCIAAGDSAPHPDNYPSSFFAPDAAWEIMTGAPFPMGFDACIRVEAVKTSFLSPASTKPQIFYDISIAEAVRPHQHRRFEGEDLPLGHPIITQGTKITPNHVMLLAAVGIPEIEVYEPLKVGIISTGNEIVDLPSYPLIPSPTISPPLTPLAPPTTPFPNSAKTLSNSNSPYLRSILSVFPVTAQHVATIPDTPSLLTETIQQHLPQYDVLITTGGVSMGKHDHMPPCLKECGVKVEFHGVEMRPGRPVLVGRWEEEEENGGGEVESSHQRRRCTVFALPGTPSGTAACFKFLVDPFLRATFGMNPSPCFRARLQIASKGHAHGDGCGGHGPKSIHSLPRSHCRVRWFVSEQGQVEAELKPGHGMRPILEGNGWAVIEGKKPEDCGGDLVDVFADAM
ncbi:hypothetical protein HDV00_003170 [Rhizophlyctis rosea]|nr:hypothetical protein HDV00_003170 [Rhizophlyctis rosea]